MVTIGIFLIFKSRLCISKKGVRKVFHFRTPRLYVRIR